MRKAAAAQGEDVAARRGFQPHAVASLFPGLFEFAAPRQRLVKHAA
jgi:hypothetical protein